MDKDTLEELLAQILDEVQQVKAMAIEVLEWKSQIEEAMANVQTGGFLGIMGKMLAK